MPWTAATLIIKDAAGTNQPVIAYTDGVNYSFAHPLLDSSGQPLDPAQKSAVSNTSGGCSTYSANGASGGNALLTNTAVQVKSGASNLYGIDFVNTGTAAAYVQIFDALLVNITVGATPPKLCKWVPANGAWEEKFSGESKVSFANGIAVAATSSPTGAGAPTSALLANIVYK